MNRKQLLEKPNNIDKKIIDEHHLSKNRGKGVDAKSFLKELMNNYDKNR